MKKDENGNSGSQDSVVHTTKWTIEPHGNGFALYSGRGPMSHGMNRVYLSEPDGNWEVTKRMIEAAPDMMRVVQRFATTEWMGEAELNLWVKECREIMRKVNRKLG